MNNVEMLTILKDVKKNGVTVSNCQRFDQVLSDLTDKVNKENAKANNNTKVLKVAKEIVKMASKGYVDILKGCVNSIYSKDEDVEYYCDQHVALKSFDKLGIEKAKESELKIEQLFDFSNVDTDEIKLPTLAKVKNDIKEAKAMCNKRNPMIMYRIDNFYCNANYLVMALESTGAETGVIAKQKGNGCRKTPMKFVGEKAEFILLPIKIRGNSDMENYSAKVTY